MKTKTSIYPAFVTVVAGIFLLVAIVGCSSQTNQKIEAQVGAMVAAEQLANDINVIVNSDLPDGVPVKPLNQVAQQVLADYPTPNGITIKMTNSGVTVTEANTTSACVLTTGSKATVTSGVCS